jgi:hypothetical protein
VRHWEHAVDHALDSPEPLAIGQSRSIEQQHERLVSKASSQLGRVRVWRAMGSRNAQQSANRR